MVECEGSPGGGHSVRPGVAFRAPPSLRDLLIAPRYPPGLRFLLSVCRAWRVCRA